MRYTVDMGGEDEHGMFACAEGEYGTFTEAKRDYLDYLKGVRDSWAVEVRLARRLTKAKMEDA